MRRWMLWAGMMATAMGVAALGYGCGETSFGTCLDNGTCAIDGSAPLDGTTDVVRVEEAGPGEDGSEPREDAGDAEPSRADAGEGGTASCNPAGEPNTEICLVNESFGIFVSGAAGGDAGKGTRMDPLRTIAEGIAKAAMGPKRVFACAGTYDEHVVVAAAQDGVRVYGGFNCASWAYAATNVVKVVPSTAGYALEVDSLTAGATFEDMEFDSKDAQAAGASSIAVFANQSVATFRRVVMTAGNGAPGAQGDAGVNYVGVQPPTGNDADGGAGGAKQVCTCLNGDQTTGGAGGSAGPPTIGGLAGLPALGGGKAGVSGSGNCDEGAGGIGASSPDGDAGAGATTPGDLGPLGWSPTAGLPAVTAPVAQGGGGGGGNPSATDNDAGLSVSGGGGSGGCGGCGGGGGTSGRGGGSSIALVSYKSAIALMGSELTAHDGKNGGAGGIGQAGQLGGYPGSQRAPGCPGGNGGNGGNGGGGGGGAGGVSAAIGYVGTAPMETNTVSKTVGNPGAGGAGGNGAGSANAGGKGVDGVASAVLSL